MANGSVFSYYGKKIDALEEDNARLKNELQKVREKLEKVIRERDKLREDIKILEDSITETNEGQGGLGPK